MEGESLKAISEFDEFINEIEEDPTKPSQTLAIRGLRGRERRKVAKKLKRKQLRKEIAVKAREAEEARLNDREEQRRVALREREEAERIERERKEFEERERVWIERAAKKAEEDAERQRIEDECREHDDQQSENEDDLNDDGDWDYVEEGPAEIIWQGNEIIVKKKRVRIPKKIADPQSLDKDADRPTSNPLPPQSEAFSSYKSRSAASCQEILESVAQQTPNFGTEQDKAHCPFHLKTGACRFGSRCSRVHFYPDKSCTLLIKNMYNGPGIAWEQDEGLEKFMAKFNLVDAHLGDWDSILAIMYPMLFDIDIVYTITFKLSSCLDLIVFHIVISFEIVFLFCLLLAVPWVDGRVIRRWVHGSQMIYSSGDSNDSFLIWEGILLVAVMHASLLKSGLEYTDEEIDWCYEEFYEDVHTEFLKFGEILNFKVCRNGSFHLRGNVYVHYKLLESAILAYNSMNGRYFAGKQARADSKFCDEKIFLTMSQLIEQTCSHGTACNFIHCFRNPGGDYEWADWDKPPPRYWAKKMVALFGDADESTYENCAVQDGNVRSRSSCRKSSWNQERYHSRKSKSRDIDNWDNNSVGDSSGENRNRSGRPSRRKHSRNARNEDDSKFENDRLEGKNVSHNRGYSDSPRKDDEHLSSLSRIGARHPKKGRASPNYDSNTDDENDYYIEHDRNGAKVGWKHDSARRHSKSNGRSSRREHSSRQAKESVLNEYIVPVNNCESKSRNGCDYRSDSRDMNPVLDSTETIDQLDRWETGSIFSVENEKHGNHDMDGNESYNGKYKSHEERLGRQHSKTKTQWRSASQSSQRMKSTSQGEEASSSGEDVHSKEIHKDRRSHDRRKGKTKAKATRETFPSQDSNGKDDDDDDDDDDDARFHHSGKHRRRHSHKYRGGSRRKNHKEDHDKEENGKPIDLGTENLKRKGSSGKRPRSKSPAQH
ncbi:hypothetical protein Sjap_021298 [Stephania japonica]|uniref:Uncharacterized protein n=1 Tax=Stephania japonica TaxID=461633 RepID=A0AAP0EM49_9MAGN